ncbi:MBL fold metallo-hydrolase [Methanohalophilus sp.]
MSHFPSYESLNNVDILLKDGQKIPIGDGEGEIVHTPGHSQDSVCIYIKNEEILFSGDTPLIIRSKGTKYEQGYIDGLKKLKSKKIRTIYSGHGSPWHGDGQYTIQQSLEMLE